MTKRKRGRSVSFAPRRRKGGRKRVYKKMSQATKDYLRSLRRSKSRSRRR